MKKIDYLIIANLMSGSGLADKKLTEVCEFIKKHHYTYHTITIHTPQRISHLVWGEDTMITKAVVCIGGDGTISETVGFMMSNKITVPLGVIPTGTANILCDTLNLRQDGYAFLINNRVRLINVGIAKFTNSIEYFTIGIGIGFSEKYIELTDKTMKRKLGPVSYVITAIKGLFEIKPITVTTTTGKESRTRKVVLLLAFNIHPLILKIFPLFPFKNVNDDDGKINMFYLRYRTKILAIIGTFACHVLGRYNFHLIRKVKSEEIQLSSPDSCPIQIDGELRGELPVKLSASKIKIKLLV